MQNKKNNGMNFIGCKFHEKTRKFAQFTARAFIIKRRCPEVAHRIYEGCRFQSFDHLLARRQTVRI